MKKVLFFMFLMMFCSGCLTTTITTHSDKNTMIECGDKIFFIPEGAYIVDLEKGTIKEIK